MPFLEVVQLRKQFALGSAVGPISFNVEDGEFVSLLGPSGCGKTTTLRCIAGFTQPSGGDILVRGQSIVKTPPHRRGIGLVFQNYALFPHLSTFENVAFGLRLRRISGREIEQRVVQALSLVGLSGFESRFPGEISGGQQQRVAVARSLVLEPKLLLLDEPLSNLDAKLRMQMRSEIRRLQRQLAIAAIYVTHDQTEALALSDRIVVMNRGVVCQIASPRDLYRAPQSSFVADFIGSSNLLRGQARPAEDGDGSVVVTATGLTLRSTGAVPSGTSSTGEIIISIRPERIHTATEATEWPLFDRRPPNLLNARVREVVYLGENLQLQLDVNDGTPLTAVVKSVPDREPRPGDSIEVMVLPQDVHLIGEESGTNANF